MYSYDSRWVPIYSGKMSCSFEKRKNIKILSEKISDYSKCSYMY